MTSHLENLEGQLDLGNDTETSTDLVALFAAEGD
jgi:hypothetical protein